MRFILIAIGLLGLALYISNPQSFGAKKKFELSTDGRVARNDKGKPEVDFGKVAEYGASLFEIVLGRAPDSPSDSSAPPPATAPIIAATAETPAPEKPDNSRMLSAINAPDLSTREGQMLAITTALQADPAGTATLMQSAMQACMPENTPPQLVNYFTGIVQAVSQTAQLPTAQQAESFARTTEPLNTALKAWLKFMPEAQRSANTGILQYWAARPNDLIACNLPWLGAN